MGTNEFAMLGFMLTTEIQQTLNPRWLRIPSAVKTPVFLVLGIYELLGQRRN